MLQRGAHDEEQVLYGDTQRTVEPGHERKAELEGANHAGLDGDGQLEGLDEGVDLVGAEVDVLEGEVALEEGGLELALVEAEQVVGDVLLG